MNTDESELALFRAERRVREIQAKLHRWADHDPQRDLWSARCPETGTAGAGGGSGKPTGGNTGSTPRADLTDVATRASHTTAGKDQPTSSPARHHDQPTVTRPSACRLAANPGTGQDGKPVTAVAPVRRARLGHTHRSIGEGR